MRLHSRPRPDGSEAPELAAAPSRLMARNRLPKPVGGPYSEGTGLSGPVSPSPAASPCQASGAENAGSVQAGEARPRVRLRKPHRPGSVADLEFSVPSEHGIARAFGTNERAVADLVYGQILNVLHHDKAKPLDDRVVDLVAALVAELRPADAVEALLVAQMIGAHAGAMETMRRGLQHGVPVQTAQNYLSLAGKLMRTFTAQVEALNRGRGKGGVQRVVVERVNVEAGGQAIVGAVDAGGGRGGPA